MTRYFAYGSNLKQERMRQRVPSATPEGPARLEGYRISCDKRSIDGSGKANLRADSAGRVWGVVYLLDPAQWPDLDACERGYERLPVEVWCAGRAVQAHTYLSHLTTDHPVPFSWYKRIVLQGAREHALPDEWLRALADWPEREDP